jgi:ABC-type multidrug transport system ATPase subunit
MKKSIKSIQTWANTYDLLSGKTIKPKNKRKAGDDDTNTYSSRTNSIGDHSDLEIIIKSVNKLKAANLIKSYNHDKNLAISGISIEINSNEIYAIVGEKGAGKSTLMRMLYGHLASSYGDISITGKGLTYWKWIFIYKNLSIAPKEDFVFYPHGTVSEHINFYSKTRRNKNNGYKLLRELNFKGDLNDKMINIDPVEKKKIKIVIALLKNKKMIYLEEPTTGMTEEDKTRLWKVINARKKNKAIIFSTESLDEASQNATSILYLEKGKSIAQGYKNEVLSKLKKRTPTTRKRN